MQRRTTKRLSDALAGEEEDRNRRQVHLNQNPHHTYPSVNPQGPSYSYQDKGYPIQSVSSRGNLSQGNRLAATLNEPSPNYAQQPQYYDRNGGPSDWNPRENVNPTPPRQPSPIRVIPDEDVDDVIWNERDEPEPDPEENERVEDDEEDFSPPRVRNDKSREREQRDREDSREAIKPKKTSRTFLLGKNTIGADPDPLEILKHLKAVHLVDKLPGVPVTVEEEVNPISQLVVEVQVAVIPLLHRGMMVVAVRGVEQVPQVNSHPPVPAIMFLHLEVEVVVPRIQPPEK